jgi:hypothetical protein
LPKNSPHYEGGVAAASPDGVVLFLLIRKLLLDQIALNWLWVLHFVTMTVKTRLFLILWTAGMAGVLSFLLVDIQALIASIPLPEGTSPPDIPLYLLKLLSIAQSTVLVTLAVILGIWLTPKVGLHSPAAEAFAERSPFLPALRPQIVPGVIAGLAAGVAIAGSWLVAKPYLTAEFITRAEGFNKMVPAAVRFLYGGFTEEILLRWAVMTLFVWVLWKIFGRGEETPRGLWFVSGIILSALLFGVGHLPIASLIGGGLTTPLVIYVIAANSIFGIVAGFLYWLRGLEAAIIAHILAHVVLLAGISLV